MVKGWVVCPCTCNDNAGLPEFWGQEILVNGLVNMTSVDFVTDFKICFVPSLFFTSEIST